MEGKDPGRRRPGPAEVQGLSPIRAFLVVCTLAMAAGGWLLATRDASPAEAPPPVPPRSPDYALTDEEAIAEFERLNAQLMQAYEERNIALAEEVFTSDSPMLPRVRKEVDDLIESNVLSLTRFEERRTKVFERTGTRILLERTEVLYPRFIGEKGENATGDSAPEKRTVRWELHEQEGTWLIHEGTVVRRRPVDGGRQ